MTSLPPRTTSATRGHHKQHPPQNQKDDASTSHLRTSAFDSRSFPGTPSIRKDVRSTSLHTLLRRRTLLQSFWTLLSLDAVRTNHFEPSDRALPAVLKALLRPILLETEDWSLARFDVGETLRLWFRHGDDQLELWVAPATAKETAYRNHPFLPHRALGDCHHARHPLFEPSLRRHPSDRRTPYPAGTRLPVHFLLPPPPPTALVGPDLELRITTRCNEACPFCSAKGWSENRISTPEAILVAMSQAKTAGAKRVVFSGGEPTLVPHLPHLVAQAKSLGLGVVLQTNGLLPANPAWWSLFTPPKTEVPLLPDSIFLSLHTQHPHKMQDLTGLADTLHKKLATARLAHQFGLGVAINFVVTQLNLSELNDFPRFVVARLGRWPELVISVAAPVGDARIHPDLLVSMTQLAPPLGAALKTAKHLGLSAQVAEACGVPICVSPAHASQFAAYHRTDPVARLANDRTKPPTCSNCRFDSKCIGIWSFYADRFGTDEFVPVA